MSSTNEGNPPIDMKVTKPKTKDAHEPLACIKKENTMNSKKVNLVDNFIQKEII